MRVSLGECAPTGGAGDGVAAAPGLTKKVSRIKKKRKIKSYTETTRKGATGPLSLV